MSELPFNAREIVALTSLPSWALAGLAAVLVAALLLGVTATRGAPASVRGGLFALRALLALGVFALALEPGLRLMSTSREPNRVVIAVDTSGSMAEDEDGQRRSQRAARAALEVVKDLEARSAPFTPELWLFDEAPRRAAPDELAALAGGALVPEGKVSRLAAGLATVQQGDGAPPLGGVVLISDGADTTGLGPALAPELREAAARLGAPVHAVTVGSAARFKDIALERVVADELAFVRNKLTIDVNVRSKGYDATIPLTLKEDGRPVATTDAVVEDGGSVKASFTFEPQRAGERIYTITAPVLAGESIAENNRVDFALKLIRDRIRVLLVAGQPSWDERYVRRLLKENPSVDLISFFILRSTTDLTNAGNRELSLIPFPTRELFTEELGTFDVVIFQDFNYRPYQMAPYLENVKQFVEESGGGFMMIGGELSFSEGEYEGTPVADVLPVTLLPGNGHLSTEPFSPLLTEAGRSHPITDLGEIVGGAALQDGLAALPPLEGVNVVAGVRPGAEVLLAHPFLNLEGKPAPVVVVGEIGKGRSMAVLTDSTWVWGLPHVGNGGRGDAHRRFFANALRWLIRDPELSRARIVVDVPDAARGVEPGAPIPLEVRTFNPKYQPEAGDAVKITLTPLDAVGVPSTVLEGVTGDDGLFRTTFTPPAPGAWRARVDALGPERDGRKPIGSDEDAFVVRATAVEKLFTEPRPDIMAAIAGSGGGRAVGVDEVAGLPFVDHQVERVHRQKTEPLWNRWWAAALLVALGGAEWWWRRRRGFA